ncbi:hypothetical protein TCAL_00484 [Tigriopus californicus]|uniref:ER membrane protein complex subunit 7 beta-sandwich domain-containing protein n=1 Tax=Tigriopus californicus TaxID=6832 RepID=A0A553NAX3_TIGCA|nr:ER membrane protein complex subunit 7 homolog [Tigriopus californicus]TRY62596.1 hypothetical protein TCAL_00484 [Tigriopus californicus]|eukprot:TCALIF_00484-PA protein Name:"Similar to EMC7 ER membrane protein complex subunit 7 (Macaca fascicularis)" AED:0.02 eAED:0.02 QI:294/1/1/1/1/1/3/109/234
MALVRGVLSCLALTCVFWSLPTRASTNDAAEASSPNGESTSTFFRVEGKVVPPENKGTDFYWRTRIVVEGGKRVAFLKEDNSFAIHGLSSGSYLVEVLHPDFFYEPVRIDITSKGKIRARKVNNVQPTQVNQVPYPLKMKSLGRHRYFQKREEWKITDMLMNPMVMMMVLPLLLITVLPKMVNDPDTKKEMEQMQQSMNMPNQMPEMSEMIANFFNSGAPDKQKRKNKPVTRGK